MTVLVVGATGMTGQALVEQLLSRGHEVRALVRSPHKLSAKVRDHSKATVIEASVLDMTDEMMAALVKDCAGTSRRLLPRTRNGSQGHVWRAEKVMHRRHSTLV